MALRQGSRLFAVFCIALTCALGAGASMAAAEKKTVRLAFRAAETGFDPHQVYDRYSVGILENVYESPLTYDWLARPLKLAPMLLENVPEPEEGGARYTLRFKRGIYYADDPAFNGKRRELTAKDFEYSIRRFRDPANRSPYEWLFENKIVGLDEHTEKSKKAGKYDFETPIEGLKLLDTYTLQIRLKAPDFNFLYFLAMPNVVPVAREVIEKYKDDTQAHPVGTGPYVLKEWVRRSKIVLERNPGYRGHMLNTAFADPKDEWDQGAIKALAGKTLPLIDRIEIYPIEQEQPRYLAFVNGEHDYIEETPFEFIEQVLPNGKLAPAFAKKGMLLFREEQMEFTYDLFNMEDKLVGGYTPEKIAFRRALILAPTRELEKLRGQLHFVEHGGNEVGESLLPELVRRGIVPDVLTDQTSAHDLRLGYIPAGYMASVVTGGQDSISNPIGLRFVRLVLLASQRSSPPTAATSLGSHWS